jgi:hypothetical protein
MDSQFSNILNSIVSNNSYYNNIVNKNINKFNKELNEIQKEINSLNNLSIDLVSLVVSKDDIFLREDILRIIIGLDFYNAIVNFVPTYDDIEPKVKELLEQGKKYIIVGFGRFNEVFDTIFYLTELYPDVLFITLANAPRFLRKKNIKSLQPTSIKFSEEYFKLLKKDYDDLYINENKKLKIVGLYSSLDTTLTVKLFIDEFAKKVGIEIFWIEAENYNQKIWYDYLNNLDYYFEIIWLLFNPTFLNDKISIYYIKQYLYKSYFDTAILAYPFPIYRLNPFNNILSKSYFFDFNTSFPNPYFILKDVLTSTLLRDQYQKSNFYFQQFTEYNNFLDNENIFKVYFSNKIFTDFIPLNLNQKIFIDFINILSEESYKDFIRLDSKLQDILIDKINQVKNKYIASTINQKINFQDSISIFYNNLNYLFNFNGFLINNLSSIDFLGINFIEKGDIILNYNVPLLSQCIVKGFLNDQINNLSTNIFLQLQDTTFNISFRKNLYSFNNQQNASLQLLNRSNNYFNYVDNQFNSMNRIFQNMLWFYIYSTQNINSDILTVFYIPQNKLNNQFNIRLLFNVIDDETNDNLYFGFENKLGDENNIISTISSDILNISNFSTFRNLLNTFNVQFNNILIGTDYYNKSFQKNDNNNFNILIDVKKIYETLNFININSIYNNNNLQSVMLSIYQEYIVKENWLQEQIILNPNFSPINDIPWDNILDNIGTVFEKNDKFYNIRYQMKDLSLLGYDSSKFYLWNDIDNNIPTFMKMINTEFIDEELVINENNKIGIQYNNLNSNTGLKELFLNNGNNVNSLDVNLYRKLYNNNNYNNFLYDIFSEENVDEKWIESSEYFINDLEK